MSDLTPREAIDPELRRVWVIEEELRLTATEFGLLRTLLDRARLDASLARVCFWALGEYAYMLQQEDENVVTTSSRILSEHQVDVANQN